MTNWANEFEHWTNWEKTAIISGNEREREAEYALAEATSLDGTDPPFMVARARP